MSVTASLTSFIDFNCVLGPQRIRVPAGLRAMYDDPTRHPWAYYGPMIEAIRGGLAAGNLPERLERATADAETRVTDGWFRGQWRHYRELSEGALLLSHRVGPVSVFPVPTGSWTHGELTLRVSPHLGVERRDGRREAWFLYPKERPLAQVTADAAVLGAAGVVIEQIYADPALLIRPTGDRQVPRPAGAGGQAADSSQNLANISASPAT